MIHRLWVRLRRRVLAFVARLERENKALRDQIR